MASLRRCPRTSPLQHSGGPLQRRIGRAFVAAAVLALAAAAFRLQPAAHAQASTSDAAPLATPLAVAWKFTGTLFGNNPASPVVQDGIVYFATGNHLFAVNAATGQQKWRYPSDQAATTNFTVAATPAVSGDLLFVGASDGMYALNTSDGTVKWHYNLPSVVSAPPIIVGSTVYFTAQNSRLYAIDIPSGNALPGVWNVKRNPGIDLGGDLSTEPAVGNGFIYYVTGNQVLHAIDLTSGVQKYGYRVDDDVKSAAPVISGESMYIATGNVLSSYRLATGQRRWFLKLYDAAVAPPAVDADGNAYIVTADRYVYAINAQSRSLWRKSVRVEDTVITRPLISGNLLILGTAQGGVYALSLADGELKWSYKVIPSSTNPNYTPTVTNVAARPVVADGTLFVLTDDGTLTAFRHDAPDTLPPTVSQLIPEQGDYLNGRPPFRISAKVVDEGSGINPSTLRLQLDGKPIARRPANIESSVDRDDFVWNPDTSTIEYITQETEAGRGSELKDGHHTVTISVKDWMGNEANKSWSFMIDDTIPRRSRNANGSTPGGPSNSGGRGGTSKD